MENLAALLFLLWYATVYVILVKSGSGASRYFTYLFAAVLFSIYLPLLALGPAATAFAADIRARIRDSV